MLIRPGFFRKNVVVCQRNERKTENGRRRQNFGEILVKTLKNRNTGLFEPIGGCGPTNMTNGGGMNMVVLKNYKIKEQNGMYYIVPSSVPGCPQCGGEMKIRDSKYSGSVVKTKIQAFYNEPISVAELGRCPR